MEPTEQGRESSAEAVPVFEPPAADETTPVTTATAEDDLDLPEEDASQEVESQAQAVLGALDNAIGRGGPSPAPPEGPSPYGQPWRDDDFDDSYGMSAGVSDMGEEPFEPTVRREPAFRPSREPKTLEDLYDLYPQIGDGSTYLRVHRKMPMNWRGARVGGWIKDLHDQISLQQFAEDFGGYRYEVMVRGPARASDPDQRERTLASIHLEISGPPTMFRGQDGEDNVQHMRHYPGTNQDDTRLRIKEMELNHERERERERELRRAREAAANNNRPAFDANVIRVLDSYAESRLSGERSATGEIIQQLRDTTDRLQKGIEHRDRTISDQREKLSQVERESERRWREEESRQIRELKENQAREISRLKEDHAARIASMQGDHERRIDEMEKRHTQQEASIRDMEQRERERLRDDAHRREKALQDEAGRREREFRDRENMLQKEAARREESIKADYQLRFETLERQNKRDLELIRSAEGTKATLAENNASNNIQMFEREMNRQTQHITQLEHENTELRSELSRLQAPKPLMQQIEESHRIAEMTGFKGGGEQEENWDWKKVVAKIAMNAIDRAPETMANIEHVRAQNQRQAMAEQQRMAMAQRQAQGGFAPHQLPQPHHAPAPPPQWDQGSNPPAPGSAPAVPHPNEGPVMAEPPQFDHHMGSPPPPGPTPPPISANGPPIPQGGAPSFAMGPEVRPTGEQPQAAAQPMQPPPMGATSSVAPAAPMIEIQPEHLKRFFTELEDAIKSDGMINEGLFAREFIAEVGPDTTRALMMAFNPQSIIQMIEQARDPSTGAAATSIIMTRRGKKYLNQLWVELHGQLG